MSVFLKPVKRGEASIQKAECAYLKTRGYETNKFTSPGRRSVPDTIVFAGNGLHFFIEWKRPGEEPTPLQRKDHEHRRARRDLVGVSHCRAETIDIVDEFERMHPRA